MQMSNLSIDPSTAAAPGAEGAAGAGAAPADGSGERFAGELAQAQAALPAGQNLAAGALPLQTLTLGPALELVTLPSDQPDGDSLAAFAKSQGLDDDVVAWLFSDATQAQVQAQAMVTIPVPPGVMALPGSPAGAPLPPTSGSSPLAGTATGAGATAVSVLPIAGATVLPGLPHAGAAVLPGLPFAGGPATVAQGLGLAGEAGKPTGPTAGLPLAAAAAGTPSPADAAAATPMAGSPLAAPSLTASSAGILGGAPDGDGVATALLATTATTAAAGWLRGPTPAAPTAAASDGDLALTQSQAATAQMQTFSLAAAVRSGRAAAMAEPARAAETSAEIPVEILNLEIEPGLEALWDETESSHSSLAGGQDRSGAGLSPGSGGAGQADKAGPSNALAQRAAGYQELSQRLGEAMAQRVISQIERGNWEIRLLLKPARLGEVEIELNMRSGALDAAFRATNPVTRDLLNDGLSRLREVLTGAGMDIAGLNVGGGRNQQSGGNPTPRQAESMAADVPRGTTASPAPVDAAAPRARSTGAGWDVLV